MSRTLGPRMNRTRTREVVDKLGIVVVTSNGHGIEIRRTICPSGLLSLIQEERWRLQTGGGIAGNSDQVWLAPIKRGLARPLSDAPYATRGPFWNKAQLEKALRAWRRGL